MTKSKESVERKLEMNKRNPLEVADAIEQRYKKSTISRESAKLSGTGIGEEK